MFNQQAPKGGAFLLEPGNIETCFIPENLTDEHRMMYKTVLDFITNEIYPNIDKIETKDTNLNKELLSKAGKLGLLAIDIPEEFGGLGLDMLSNCIVAEGIGNAGSFAVSINAHSGIGTLPILYYGNQKQKAKYLPDLANGNKFAAYALTEAGAGSDAIGGCRTKAILSNDGKFWILNGEKMFITNGGWAESIIVFAKIDGIDFSAFIVERNFPGVSSGAEEKKMGINGSSTTSIILEDAKIPVENLLYERGQGHIIAMNVLNIGRYKLGASSVGAAKGAIKTAVIYANNRIQFGQPISKFGTIREKLVKMATKIYISEAVVYRTVGLIEASLSELNSSNINYGSEISNAIREYAIECSINKVLASEMLDYIVDECVQIHGGYGYSSEYPAESYYRNARINRIFEGTNEINRLLIPGEFLKRGMKGKLSLIPAAQKIFSDIIDYSPLSKNLSDEVLGLQTNMVEIAKKVAIFVAGTAIQKFSQKIANEQEILIRIADLIIEIFAMESGLLRAKKIIKELGIQKANLYIAFTQLYIDESLSKINTFAKETLAYIEEGDTLTTLLASLRRFMKYQPINAIAIRKNIAEKIIEKGGYPLSI